MITVRYTTIDRFSQTRRFKTLAGAQRFAQKWVGETPEIGMSYAVSADGVGKITVTGCWIYELFPACKDPFGPKSEETYGLGYMQQRGAS